MNLFFDWKFYVVVYLLFATTFNQSYKITLKSMKSAGAITVLIQLISSAFCVLLIPLFALTLPNDYKVYIFLFLAIIFYTLNDRLGTTARSGLDASIYSILKQLSTVFMIFVGILFFKEPFVLNKFIGSVIIIFSNLIVFYKQNTIRFNKHLILGILANLCLSIALFLDVNYSNQFNLAFYVFLTLFIPALLIFFFEKIKFKQVLFEYKNSNKLSLILTSISWSVMMISKLKAYTLGNVVIVATLTSLTVILNVIFGYFLLKEKDNLTRKIMAALLIIIGIILIKL